MPYTQLPFNKCVLSGSVRVLSCKQYSPIDTFKQKKKCVKKMKHTFRGYQEGQKTMIENTNKHYKYARYCFKSLIPLILTTTL